MRKSALILFVILFTLTVSAQDTLTVMAKSGVFLRGKADVKSAALKKIDYGEKVIALLDSITSTEFKIEEIKDFFVSGRMIRVNYKGTEGYVFSGFLTKFPMPVIKTESRTNFLDLDYLQDNFSSIGKHEIEKYRNCEGYKNCICSCREKFEGGIEHYSNSCSEKGVEVNISIPQMSIIEAYFLAKALYISDWEIYLYNKYSKEIIIKPKDGGAGCYYSITEKNRMVLIKYECGC